MSANSMKIKLPYQYRPMSVTQSFYHTKLHWPRHEKKRHHFLDFVFRCGGTGYDWDYETGCLRQTEPQIRDTGKTDEVGDPIRDWWDHWWWCLPGWVYPIAFWLWYPIYRVWNSRWNQNRLSNKRVLKDMRENGYPDLAKAMNEGWRKDRGDWWKQILTFTKPKLTLKQKMMAQVFGDGPWQPFSMWGCWETEDSGMDVVETDTGYNAYDNHFDGMPDNVRPDWLAAAHECLDTVINGKWRKTYFAHKKEEKPTVHFQPIKEKKYARKLKKRLLKRFAK